MSHHFDSAADRADGRINPCDLYTFPGAPGTTTFILTVNPDAELDALNAASPTADRDTYSERVSHIASTAARLAGLPDPAGHAARVVAAFLPDVLTYRPGQPADFHPGDGNGRALGDNAFDIAVAVLAGTRLANASTPRQATPAFPYLPAPQPADLPPLADYFRSPQAPAR